LLGIGAAPLTVLALAAGIAVAAPSHSGAHEIVKVAAGRSGGVSWAVGMGLHGGERCYAISADRNGFSGIGSVCGGPGVEGDWQPATGNAGDGTDTALQLDLTSAPVRTLHLSVHQINGEPVAAPSILSS
jgi:hypothetical protein